MSGRCRDYYESKINACSYMVLNPQKRILNIYINRTGTRFIYKQWKLSGEAVQEGLARHVPGGSC